jgi:histone H2A
MGDINFRIYNRKILGQVHPDTKLTKTASDVMNGIVNVVSENITRTAEKMSKKTITERSVQTAVRICLGGELGKHAVSEGTKAVTKVFASKESKQAERTALAKRAGLQIPPARMRKILKKNGLRVAVSAAVYLAAVLEYLVAEIFELAGNAARDAKKSTLNIRHMMLAIENDEELIVMFRKMKIKMEGAGVLPNICHQEMKAVNYHEKKVREQEKEQLL